MEIPMDGIVPSAAQDEPELVDNDEEETEEIDLSSTYWALWPADKLIGQLNAKEDAYFDAIQRGGYGNAWLGAYAAYHGLDPDALGTWATQNIGFDGDNEELLRFRINESRSYLNQGMNMAIGKRPAFQALAVNDDYETLAGVEDADTAVNFIYWKNYGERKERRTVLKGDLFGFSWTWVIFDPKAGPLINKPVPLPPEMGGGDSPEMQQVPKGELVIKSKAPWEVWNEPYIEEFDDHVWRCVNDKVSKWEIAARLDKPEDEEKRKKIIAMSCRDEHAIELFFGLDHQAINEDEIIVKHFYHSPTRAAPKGRYFIYAGDVVIYDGPLPFQVIPLADYCPSEYLCTAFGYAEYWDMIPINQMMDQICSDWATNLSAFGRQNIFVEDGTDLEPQQIADGINVFAMPPGAQLPQGMVLAEIPESARWALDYLERRFQSLSGQNGVTRGDTTQMPSSGTLAALYHSVALEANSAKATAVDAHRERVANLLLMMINDFMDAPIMVQITGADGRTGLKSIDKQIFNGFKGVIVKTAEPMLKSQAGKMEIAGKMLEIPGVIQTPEQLIEVCVSGQVTPLYKAPRAELLRIAAENQVLSQGPKTEQVPDPENPVTPDGQPNFYTSLPSVPALATDHPVTHIKEHLAILSTRAAMDNPDVMGAVLAHVYDHVRVWKDMDPALAALLGFPPPPPPPEMAAMGGEVTTETEEKTPDGTVESLSKELKTPEMKNEDPLGVKLPKPAQSPIQQ